MADDDEDLERDERDERDDDGEGEEIELNPTVAELLEDIDEDRRTLLKNDKAGESVLLLKQFVANTVIARQVESVEVLGEMGQEIWEVAAAAMNDLMRLRAYVLEKLAKLGVDVSDAARALGNAPLPLVELQEAVASLGVVLASKLPKDKEAQEAYQAVYEAVERMIQAPEPAKAPAKAPAPTVEQQPEGQP